MDSANTDNFTPLLSEIQRKLDAAIKEKSPPSLILKLSNQSVAVKQMRSAYLTYLENI